MRLVDWKFVGLILTCEARLEGWAWRRQPRTDLSVSLGDTTYTVMKVHPDLTLRIGTNKGFYRSASELSTALTAQPKLASESYHFPLPKPLQTCIHPVASTDLHPHRYLHTLDFCCMHTYADDVESLGLQGIQFLIKGLVESRPGVNITVPLVDLLTQVTHAAPHTLGTLLPLWNAWELGLLGPPCEADPRDPPTSVEHTVNDPEPSEDSEPGKDSEPSGQPTEAAVDNAVAEDITEQANVPPVEDATADATSPAAAPAEDANAVPTEQAETPSPDEVLPPPDEAPASPAPTEEPVPESEPEPAVAEAEAESPLKGESYVSAIENLRDSAEIVLRESIGFFGHLIHTTLVPRPGDTETETGDTERGDTEGKLVQDLREVLLTIHRALTRVASSLDIGF